MNPLISDLLVTRYRQLEEGGTSDHREVVREGSIERLSPILMTALATGVALLPLALARGETGNEIDSSPLPEILRPAAASRSIAILGRG